MHLAAVSNTKSGGMQMMGIPRTVFRAPSKRVKNVCISVHLNSASNVLIRKRFDRTSFFDRLSSTVKK